MCKDCKKSYHDKWRAENREKWNSYSAKYTAENAEREKARKSRWQAENPEKVKASRGKWAKANPDKLRAKLRRRRAKKRNAQGDHTVEQLQARFDYHGNKCVYCDSTENLHADHQIPLSRGGTNFASNMVPACASCNTSKGTKTPIEFADYTFKQLQAMLGK
jgi:5-methylcytosine-specific restriction endonuclease McrA